MARNTCGCTSRGANDQSNRAAKYSNKAAGDSPKYRSSSGVNVIHFLERDLAIFVFHYRSSIHNFADR